MPLDQLYAQRLIVLAKNLPKPLPLIGANGFGKAHAKLCGSTIEIEIHINDHGQITDIAGEINACALGKAATAILCKHIPGLTKNDIHNSRQWIEAILKGEAVTLPKEWHDLQLFEAAQEFPLRHPSILLIWTALEQAIQDTP